MAYSTLKDVSAEAPAFRNMLYPDSLNILLVEDARTDEILTRNSINSTHFEHDLKVLHNGTEVLPYLWHCIEAREGNLPDVILLDLCLPTMNGFEVLEELSLATPVIRSVPIVILTGHDNFQYICKGTNLCMLGYIPKPCDPMMLNHILQLVQSTR